MAANVETRASPFSPIVTDTDGPTDDRSAGVVDVVVCEVAMVVESAPVANLSGVTALSARKYH